MEGGRLGVPHRQNANRHFRCVFIVRAIDCDRCDWITAEDTTGFSLPGRIRASLDSHLITSVARAARSTQTAHGAPAHFFASTVTGEVTFDAYPVNHGGAESEPVGLASRVRERVAPDFRWLRRTQSQLFLALFLGSRRDRVLSLDLGGHPTVARGLALVGPTALETTQLARE